ncbi:hypothetical protein Pfo_028510 [Paulownia fortunei]|nr:hypothetical protein Pfo_028510 [Paulownia fortunei]
MEMPGRRYTLLSKILTNHFITSHRLSSRNRSGRRRQLAQQPLYYESHSGEKNKLKSERAAAFDWDAIDQRMVQVQSQQSGSERRRFGVFWTAEAVEWEQLRESSMSGDYLYHRSQTPRVKTGRCLSAAEASSFKELGAADGGELPIAAGLALRLSSQATCADDLISWILCPMNPHPLSSSPALQKRFLIDSGENTGRELLPSFVKVEILSPVNGCLSYFDKVPDGFYMIHGMDPYVWAVCSDHQESGRIPSLESLKTVDPAIVSSVEVISVDRRGDPSLKELQNRIHNLSSSCITTKEIVDQLAKLVCNHMGGAASSGEDGIVTIWKECSDDLKDCLGSVVLPIGSLSVGLCRHRALLFKVLADIIGLPCRIARGCKCCTREDASSCLVRFGLDREYLIDLVEKPGCLCEPDSLLNGPSTISISSPLRFPRFRQVEPTIDFRLLAKQFFSDFQSLNLKFDDSLAAGTVNDGDTGDSSSSNREEISNMQPFPTNSWIKVRGKEQLISKPSNTQDIISSTDIVKGSIPLKLIPPIGHKDVHPLISQLDPRVNTSKDTRFGEGGQLVPSKTSEFTFDIDDLNIPWSDLVLKERIGAGSFGTVHRAEWNGCDVAVKILMEQDFHAERFKEFLREVAIMKRLRHPNIVLFMGAVTEPPNLSIVTEYLSRGSLYRLLHKPGAKETMDERRRLSMAYDVVCIQILLQRGMNYLHKHNPPIVHRDLKSPNLLVDRKYTVKVSDFGLSRLKANTFLSSKSAAGTPEWMAPEVLRDEPSNEKSDLYSFGVILWELATLQQPWGNLNPHRLVVAAVGFKGKRLEIPRDMNPHVAAIIEACWANEPWKRPSFSSIMETLRPLIKSPPPTQPGCAEMPLLM